MWTHVSDLMVTIFGGDYPPDSLTVLQVAARSALLFLVGIAIVRVGKSRLISRATAIDVLLGFILGSLLSRGMTGHASLSGTIASAAVLVAIHWLLTLIACHNHRFGDLIKGHAHVLIKDGVVNRENLRKSHFSDHDLIEELRLNANIDDPRKVKVAYKERSGEVGIVRAE